MKKLITLCLALAGMVSTASADTTYYVAGSKDFISSEGEWGDYKQQLTDPDGDGIYTYTVEQTVSNTTYYYKFITSDDGGSTLSWDADPNREITFTLAGKYRLTFSIDTNDSNARSFDYVLLPTSVTFVGQNITGSTWASTEESFTDNGDNTWSYLITENIDNVYFRFKINGQEFQTWHANNTAATSNYTFNFTNGMTYNINTKDGNTWGNFMGADKIFELPKFSSDNNYKKYMVKIIPGSQIIDIYVEVYESAKMNANGYITYVNTNPLNISGAAAYYAVDTNDGSATATAFTNPEAGTPMLIKGTANETYYFAVAASGTALGVTNAFKAGDGSVVYGTDGSNYNYVLNGDAFYLAKSETNGGTTVASGKAYLQLSQQASAGARVLRFADDETQGINAISTVKAADGAYYNLSGQRVNAPVKGLYIQNGKKMIVK